MKNIKTSLTINKELHKKLKILAIELEIPYSKLLDNAIKNYLDLMLHDSGKKMIV